MPEPRRLRTPPITEAIIDLRVELEVGFDATRLRAAESLLPAGYVLGSEQHLLVRTFAVSEAADISPRQEESTLTGYLYRSRDGRFVAQLTVEGLTVSQLKDYTNWEDL